MKKQNRKASPTKSSASQTQQSPLKLQIAEVIFDEDFPEDERVRFYAYLLKYQIFIPTWVHEIRLRWVFRIENDVAMQVQLRPEYREAYINISEECMRDEVENAETNFVHELAHLMIGPLYCCSVNITEGVLEGQASSVKNVVTEALRQANESSTQDLARAIYAAINK